MCSLSCLCSTLCRLCRLCWCMVALYTISLLSHRRTAKFCLSEVPKFLSKKIVTIKVTLLYFIKGSIFSLSELRILSNKNWPTTYSNLTPHDCFKHSLSLTRHRRPKRALDCNNYCIFDIWKNISLKYILKWNLLAYLIVCTAFVVILLL